MKFAARHISFRELEEVPGVWLFSLGDLPGLPGEDMPETFVILQFGNEDDQDRALGLTGLHLEVSEDPRTGYGQVERIDYDREMVSIIGREGRDDVHASVATDMMTPEAIRAAVERCNLANATRPERAY
jgi:hypothetical protein